MMKNNCRATSTVYYSGFMIYLCLENNAAQKKKHADVRFSDIYYFFRGQTATAHKYTLEYAIK